MNGRSEALAFRIWQFCEPLGWNVTHGEIANHIGASYQQVSRICQWKGWAGRLRTTHNDFDGGMLGNDWRDPVSRLELT